MAKQKVNTKFIKKEAKPVNEVNFEEGDADMGVIKEEKEVVIEKPVYVWCRDINFGQHKVGDIYEGHDIKIHLEKGWIKQK